MKLAIIIPAHNEERTIARVVNSLPKKIDGISSVQPIVVNDASKDSTVLESRKTQALVLNHRLNLGQGAAVLTGITAAKRLGNNLVVTLDGDGQHDPADIPKLVTTHLQTNADLIIGSRFLSQTISTMPRLKWYGNKLMNGITYTFSGEMVTDSQSGFRLFSERLLSKINHFHMSGYEFCSEMIVSAKRHNLMIKEVPITTIYFNERKGGQNPINGINIMWRLLYRTVTG